MTPLAIGGTARRRLHFRYNCPEHTCACMFQGPRYIKQLEFLNPWFLGARLAIHHPFIHVFAEQYPMPGSMLGIGEMEHPEYISLVALCM